MSAPACWVRIDMSVPYSYASTRMAPAIAPWGAAYVDVYAFSGIPVDGSEAAPRSSLGSSRRRTAESAHFLRT